MGACSPFTLSGLAQSELVYGISDESDRKLLGGALHFTATLSSGTAAPMVYAMR